MQFSRNFVGKIPYFEQILGSGPPGSARGQRKLFVSCFAVKNGHKTDDEYALAYLTRTQP